MEFARLGKALAVMLAIIANTPDGRNLVPVVLRLEVEIRSHQSTDPAYGPILKPGLPVRFTITPAHGAAPRKHAA